ncbi:hypothetical protein ES703_11023 [subsurface metagenome]
MVRKQKWIDYGFETKTRSIRIPKLDDLDKERNLMKAIDELIIEKLFTPKNAKENINEIDTEIIKKMIPAFIKYEISIDLKQKEANRLEQLVSEVMDNG